MSYLVLARKYRPRSFEALVGQEHVVQALVNALTRRRLHHAYLFSGTRGVGKTTVSRVLAKALNCTGSDGRGDITPTPCGACDACRDIDAGRFVDYVELDAASNRGVDEITQLLDQAVYKPVLGRFKVYMIDEVHMLSNHAFNAMLKTLEEPPEYLKFVLATTDPQKVPPTVLSRCLQFNLRPMAPQTIQTHLAGVLEAEAIAGEPAALRLLARAARGSMRDALSLADQAIAYGAGSLDEAGVRQMLGAVDRSHAVRLLAALGAGDGPALVQAADGLRTLGLSATGTLEEMAELLQQIALAQAVPEAIADSDADRAGVVRLAGRIAADEVQLYYGMCLHGRAELALAPDEHSGLLMVLLRMLAFRPAGAAAGQAVERADPGVAAGSVANPARVAAAALLAPQAAKARAVAWVPAEPLTDTSAAAPTAEEPATAQRDQRLLAGSAGSGAASMPEPPPWLDIPFEAVEGPAEPQPAPDAELPAAAAAALAVRNNLAQGLPSSPEMPAVDAFSRPSLGVVASSAPAASAASGETAAPPGPNSCAERWATVVSALCADGRISALTRELAMQSECFAIEEVEGEPVLWRLRVEREALRAAAHCERLQKALAAHFGTPLRIDVSTGAALDSPAQRAAATRQRRQHEAERTINDDPVVQSLLRQFETARIVPGSIHPC